MLQIKMNKLFTILTMFVLMFSFTSALDCFETFEQNTEIELIQKCPSCSYVNITAITYPNGTVFMNEAMTQTGTNFYYNLTDTSQTGKITYTTIGDKEGSVQYEDLCIEINLTGDEATSQRLGSTIFILVILAVVMLSLVNIHRRTDFDKWYDKVLKKDTSFIKSAMAVIPYTFMRNIYLVYYLLGIPTVLLISNLLGTYNITSIASIFESFAMVYTVGMVLVGLVFLSEMIKIMLDLWDNFQNNNWGINGK